MSAAAATHTGQGTLAGTWSLVGFTLRRDRFKLLGWILGAALFWFYCTRAVPIAYPNPEDLEAIKLLLTGPTGRMWLGPTYFLDDLTHQTLIPSGYGLYLSILVALMSILLVVRNTRVEEQSGRADLVRAGVVGRHAPLAATTIVVLLANLAVAIAVLLVMISDPLFDLDGAVLFAAGQFVTGLAFAGLTLLVVQVTEYSRTATSISAGLGLGGAFLLRAIGDMGHEHGTWLSWCSPLAWPQQTAPYILDRWWPLALSLTFAVVTSAAGAYLSTRRDVGGGFVAPRRGNARASVLLGSPLGLAWRLERRAIAWWALVLFMVGLGYGAFVADLVTEDMPEAILMVLGGEENIRAAYLAFTALFNVICAAIYAVLAVQGLRAEEAGGRGEAVLATATGRTSWLGSTVAVAALGSAIIVIAAGVGLGVGAAAAIGEWDLVGELLLAHLNSLPPVFVVLGIAVLLFGIYPRGVGLTWLVVGWGFLAATLAQVLPDLPELLISLSPFEHPARMPLEEFAARPVVWLSVIALACVAVGILGFRGRDIQSW